MDKDSEILFNQIQMEFKKIENWNNSKTTSVEYELFCERCSPQIKQIKKNLFDLNFSSTDLRTCPRGYFWGVESDVEFQNDE